MLVPAFLVLPLRFDHCLDAANGSQWEYLSTLAFGMVVIATAFSTG